MAKTFGEISDQKLAQDTHDYCEEPEYERCPNCLGLGVVGGWENITGILVKQDCKRCDGTGRILKITYRIEEDNG